MDIANIVGQFATNGTLQDRRANTTGHINTTIMVRTSAGSSYVLQRINTAVFPHPAELMENIHLVTTHIASKVAGLPDASRRHLSIIPTKDGRLFHQEPDGSCWRMYAFIDQVDNYDTVADEEIAYRFGRAVGLFQSQMRDFDGDRLFITIPHFHDMAWRYAQLDAAVKSDRCGRVKETRPELAYLEENRRRGCAIWDLWQAGRLPTRVTHNDTKVNNVLFGKDGLSCMIDLDTVMPGTILFDTGDMIRTATTTAAEDAPDVTQVHCDTSCFRALLEGYAEAASFLTEAEASLLAESGRTITQIMAVRFLTDYLDGDRYYATSRPGQNLDRARNQLAFMRSMDAQREKIPHIPSLAQRRSSV